MRLRRELQFAARLMPMAALASIGLAGFFTCIKNAPPYLSATYLDMVVTFFGMICGALTVILSVGSFIGWVERKGAK